MRENFLQLNEDKTEIILFGSKEKRVSIGKYLETRALTITDQVCNLGVLIDSDLTFSSHIKAVTKAAFYRLRNINRIKGFIILHIFNAFSAPCCNAFISVKHFELFCT